MKKEELIELLKSSGVEITEDIKLDNIFNKVNEFATNLSKRKSDEVKGSINEEEIVNKYLGSKGLSLSKLEENENNNKTLEQKLAEAMKSVDTLTGTVEENQKKAQKLEMDKKLISSGVKEKFLDYASTRFEKDEKGDTVYDFDKLKNSTPEIFQEENEMNLQPQHASNASNTSADYMSKVAKELKIKL